MSKITRDQTETVPNFTGTQPQVTFDSLAVATEPKGLQPPSVWFGGGRVGAHVEHEGTIEELVYYGAQPMNRQLFFKVTKHSPYQKLFCPYLLVENRAYLLEWERTRVFPAGYVSHLSLPDEGIEITHSLIMFNDAVMYRVEALRNEHQRPLHLRLSLHEQLRHIPADRVWGDWREDVIPGALVAEITDPAHPSKTRYPNPATVSDATPQAKAPMADGELATTWLGVVGSVPLTTRRFWSGRRYFETEEMQGNAATVSILFGLSETEFNARAAALRCDGPRLGADQVAGWERRLAELPAVALDRPVVESFFRQAGLMVDMLRVTDLPGAMRAAVKQYWVWGWDTMVYCDSDLVNGRADFVRQALDLYRRTADPVLGIGHQFSEKLEVLIPQALPAQGLYFNMLYQYVTFTNDESVLEEFYPFALKIFQRTIALGRSAGLFKGTALWPDHPRFAGQSGAEGEVSDKDLSIFNNGIFYQSARAMEHLAGLMNDADTARAAREAWQPLEASFRNLFWDAERGYWLDSLESDTLAPRRCYPSHAILWINPFAKELVAGREEECADFLATQHACHGGIRPYPLWDAAFNGDGNQLAQWYPTCPDLFFLKTMGATGRQAMLKRWLGWVDAFWRQYTVPEGLTLEAENDGPHRPDCPGGKQAFTIKPWHMAIINTIAGIDLDHGGITVCPGLDEPVSLARLPFQGHQISVATAGAGIYAQTIAVNGRPLAGSCKIPADHCTDPQLHLSITRTTERPRSPQILSADGARLTGLTVENGTVRTHLDCPGSVRVWMLAPAKPHVTWKGAPIDSTYDEPSGRASVLLAPEAILLEGELTIRA